MKTLTLYAFSFTLYDGDTLVGEGAEMRDEDRQKYTYPGVTRWIVNGKDYYKTREWGAVDALVEMAKQEWRGCAVNVILQYRR